MTIVKPDGMVGLLTPSGIASDKTAARFFKGCFDPGEGCGRSTTSRTGGHAMSCNPSFPDVHSRHSNSAPIFVSPSTIRQLKIRPRCAFYPSQCVAELDDPERCFPLTAADFDRVNPNTGTAPIFRTRRGRRTNHSGLRPPAGPGRSVIGRRSEDMAGEIHDHVPYDQRFRPVPHTGRVRGAGRRISLLAVTALPVRLGDWVPLYEGKMVQAFDHRAANIVVNPENQHRPAQPVPATLEQHRNADWFPTPQFWVSTRSENGIPWRSHIMLGIQGHVTAPTNVRSMIAALIPGVWSRKHASRMLLGSTEPTASRHGCRRSCSQISIRCSIRLCIARQKIQGQHLNWFIIEQLPVVSTRPLQSRPLRKKDRRQDRA